MKFFKFKNPTTWLATWISAVTMVMTPVAMGQEAAKISKTQMQNALEQMGLNKQMTVGEFYQKNKSLYPERIQKEIEPLLNNYKNVMMPEFAVTSAKASDGRDIPTLTMSQSGQLINMQWFGEKEKYVKFQNTNLSEIDIINFTDMFTRIFNGDATLRKQGEANQKAAQSAKAEFSGLPVFSTATWKKMTLQERVTYMVQIRHMWLDARNVLFEQNRLSKNKRTAKFELLENVWAFFAGLEAEAAAAAAGTPAKPVVIKSAMKRLEKHSETLNASSCLVAGYSAQYKNGVCDHTEILKAYRDDVELTKPANEKCVAKDKNTIACNPLVYGTPGGEPICITPSRQKGSDFQIATHFGGPCDSKSLLQKSTSAISFLNDENKKAGRYDKENLKMSDDERRELFKKEQAPNFDETKVFIEGVLKSKNPGMTDFFVNGVLNEKYIEQVKAVQTLFDNEIKQSTEACRAAANDKKAVHEKNFYGACDQLQRRFLFVADFLGTKCETGSKINPSSLKCTCTDNSEVMPGGTCKPGTPAVPPATDPAKPDKPPVAPKPDKHPVITCPAGQHSETVISEISGAGDTTCVPNGGSKTPAAKEECGFLCSFGKGIVKYALPVLLGVGVLYGMYKLFSPKKPTLNPAGDSCPLGSVAPCSTVCPLPLASVNGTCACAACPPGQALASAATCICSSTITGTTTTYTCPDNVTKTTDLSTCPQASYPCWDGSVVKNPLYCPEKPTTTTTTTTINKAGR